VGACFEAAGDQGGGEEFFEVEGEGVFFQAKGLLDFGEGEVGALAEQDEDGLPGRVIQRYDEQAGLRRQRVFFDDAHRLRDADQV